jgi:hypothetical protein
MLTRQLRKAMARSPKGDKQTSAYYLRLIELKALHPSWDVLDIITIVTKEFYETPTTDD